jgi:hypothetical protein
LRRSSKRRFAGRFLIFIGVICFVHSFCIVPLQLPSSSLIGVEKLSLILFHIFYAVSAIVCVIGVLLQSSSTLSSKTSSQLKAKLFIPCRIFSFVSLILLLYWQKSRYGFSIKEYVPYLATYGISFLITLALVLLARGKFIGYR